MTTGKYKGVILCYIVIILTIIMSCEKHELLSNRDLIINYFDTSEVFFEDPENGGSVTGFLKEYNTFNDTVNSIKVYYYKWSVNNNNEISNRYVIIEIKNKKYFIPFMDEEHIYDKKRPTSLIDSTTMFAKSINTLFEENDIIDKEYFLVNMMYNFTSSVRLMKLKRELGWSAEEYFKKFSFEYNSRSDSINKMDSSFVQNFMENNNIKFIRVVIAGSGACWGLQNKNNDIKLYLINSKGMRKWLL